MMKRCIKCLLPETYASIEFDNKGVCNVCKSKKAKKPHTENDLIELLNKYKEIAIKEGRKYNCIVPFSGGKDSVFTLYSMVKKYEMTPLVVTFNHLFFTDVIKRNQENILKQIGADKIEFSPDWKIVRKLMSKSLIRTGDFCWHCHCGIYAYPMQVAVKYEIPLLIWGATDYVLEQDMGKKRDLNFFQHKVNLGIQAEEMIDDEISISDLEPFMYPPEEELERLNIMGINQADYMEWNVREQVALIKNVLGWEEAEFIEGSYINYDKIECKYIGVRDYLKFLKRGYGRTCQLASVDIRDGLISRDEGLGLMEKYDGERPDSLTPFLDDIGWSENMFMDIAMKHRDAIAGDPTIID